MSTASTLTAAQTRALAALLSAWEADGCPLVQDMRWRTAADLGASPAALAVLVRRGYVAARSESVTRWGETTRAAYRFTPRGKVYAGQIAEAAR